MNDLPNSNPYAPPGELISPSFEGLEFTDRVWRKGNLIVLPVGSELPPFCVRTGMKGEMPVKLTLAWHSRWVLVGLGVAALLLTVVAWIFSSPISFCVGAIVLMVLLVTFQKNRRFIPWLCLAEFNRRRRLQVLGYLAIAGGIGLFAIVWENGDTRTYDDKAPPLQSAAKITGMICLIIGGVMTRPSAKLLRSTLLTDNFSLLSGAKEPFLQHLEEFPNPLP